MDYGVYLKKTGPDPGRRSAAYKKQSPFKGSRREVRGGVLKILSDVSDGLTLQTIQKRLDKEENLISAVVEKLLHEGFLEKKKRHYRLIEH